MQKIEAFRWISLCAITKPINFANNFRINFFFVLLLFFISSSACTLHSIEWLCEQISIAIIESGSNGKKFIIQSQHGLSVFIVFQCCGIFCAIQKFVFFSLFILFFFVLVYRSMDVGWFEMVLKVCLRFDCGVAKFGTAFFFLLHPVRFVIWVRKLNEWIRLFCGLF